MKLGRYRFNDFGMLGSQQLSAELPDAFFQDHVKDDILTL